MAYTFTEKKRLRKSFASRTNTLPVPFLWRPSLSPIGLSCRKAAHVKSA